MPKLVRVGGPRGGVEYPVIADVDGDGASEIVLGSNRYRSSSDWVGLTVIGPDILEADRFATAAFAMGRPGIGFIEERPELEGYMVDAGGRATFTSGFEDYCAP